MLSPTLSNIAYHPFEGVIDPFVSVGGGWMYAKLDRFDTSGNGLVVRVGLGANVWLTDHLGIRVEGRYTHPITGDIEHLENVQPRVGILYRF